MQWTAAKSLLLEGGTVVTSGGSRRADVFIRDGTIVAVGDGDFRAAERVLDARGLWITPGFVDVHVHLRDPGTPESETLETGLEAAARGGIHHVYCMANTDPVNDDPDLTASLVARARALGPVTLHPVAAVTSGLQGTRLTDFAALRQAGAGALSNDGLPVEDRATLARALERAAECGLSLFVHAEDRALAGGGSVDVRAAERLHARGIPVAAEDVGTARDVEVAVATGTPLHVCHVSTRGAVAIVREAKGRGGKITAEATPHHLALSFDDIPDADTDFKMNPPLRSRDDVAALLEGIADGTVTAIATDHAPHSPRLKARPLDDAPFGAIGLETSFPVSYTALVATGRMDPSRLIALYVDGPAEIAGLAAPRIEAGAPAELNLIDPEAEWTVEPARFASRSRNCPFKRRKLRSRVVGLVVGQRLAWLR